MILNSLSPFKKSAFFVALMFFSAVSTHALKPRAHYLGGEIGYNQAARYITLGVRYMRPYHHMAGKVLLDIQPTLGISTGYAQVLRVEGGFNFGIGSDLDNVAFSFVLLGVHLELNLNIWPAGGKNTLGFGIGPSFVLPLSTNVYWKKFFFGMHWGIDAEWLLASRDGVKYGGYHTPFYVRFIVGHSF